MSVTVLHPPPPMRTARYRLQRAGLIGLYEYENQTFEFEHGRLLLRGPNGSGKSKALELLLPLMLDGELRAERLDPFGGRGRSMRWNLVGDQEARAPASGFSWLELYRHDEHDVEHWVTLVLMTRANKGETGVHSWFAIVQAHADADGELRGPRIGINASLTEGRHPISRTAFAELSGELIESASVYRERVNALLFGVAQDRYEAIVQLLLSLRKPQLSQTLNPEELSARLTEALPELDRDAVVRVSSRLDQLDRLRTELSELREVRAAVAAFTRTYRDWARAALRERGNLLLQAANLRQECIEALAGAQAAVAGAGERRAELTRRRTALDQRLASARAGERELRASDGWRAAERLEELHRLADAAERAASQANADLERAEREADEMRVAAARAGAALDQQRRLVEERLQRCIETAADAGVANHAAAVAGLIEEERSIEAVSGLLDQLAASRAEAIEAMVELMRAFASAERALATARERFETGEARQRERQAERAQAAERLEAVRADLLERLEAWLESIEQLRVDDAFAEGLADLIARAGEPGAPVARELVADRAGAAEQALRGQLAALTAERAALSSDREPLAAEHARLTAHEDPRPEPLPFRTADRAGRPGGPLWALVDFTPGLNEPAQAGLEGALEGAGLLDAWVTPDGTVVDADDAVLVCAGTQPLDGRTLAHALRPVRTGQVSVSIVEAVLAQVALGAFDEDAASSRAAVDVDGRFALGPLRGRHTVQAARYIGAAARAANRARRLAELALELAALDERDRSLQAEAQSLERGLTTLREEVRGLPGDGPAIRGYVQLERARAEEERAAELTAAELETMNARSMELRAVREQALAYAREHGLPGPGDEAGLARTRDALASYRTRCGELIGGERVRRERAQAATAATVHAERSEEVFARVRDRARESAQEASGRAGAHREAAAAVGASVEQVRGRLAALEASATDAEAGLRALHDEDVAAAEAGARAERDAAHAEETLAHAEATLAGRHAGVARLGTIGAWLLALGERTPTDQADAGRWPLERTLSALRAVPREALATRRGFTTLLTDVDHEADELRHRLAANADFQVTRERLAEDAELTLVQVRHGGQAHPVGELEEWLEQELLARERTIAEEDRRLFESFLVGGLADALRERIGGATTLVAGMNDALGQCTTSSGMQIELEWRARQHEDPGLRDAVALLRRDVALLTDDARSRLVEFLRRRIEDARHSLEQGSSSEHVMAALDYRDWHEFRVIQLKDGRREALTRRLHQQGSGGEKSVALHLPLFAAAAAQFAAAREHCPRLILLDEAFAGIDERMRAQLLGLLERFDLDFVLTSHELWGCYPECSALGIYHLHREPGIPGVATAHFRWDGRRRVEVSEDQAA
jgi:uncharacterized protein (TIGR02680 family)